MIQRWSIPGVVSDDGMLADGDGNPLKLSQDCSDHWTLISLLATAVTHHTSQWDSRHLSLFFDQNSSSPGIE